MDLFANGGILVVAILLGILVLRILLKPIKWGIKLLIHAVSGFVLLWIINFVGGMIGLHLGVTWLSCIIAGIFGIPGVIVMFLMHLI